MFCCECYQIFRHSGEWRQGVVVIITSKLHSTKSELNFCADSNLACGVSDICYDENGSARNKWRKRLSSVNILQEQFIIITAFYKKPSGVCFASFIRLQLSDLII